MGGSGQVGEAATAAILAGEASGEKAVSPGLGARGCHRGQLEAGKAPKPAVHVWPVPGAEDMTGAQSRSVRPAGRFTAQQDPSDSWQGQMAAGKMPQQQGGAPSGHGARCQGQFKARQG